MKKAVCFLLVLLTVLTAGCSSEPEQTTVTPSAAQTVASTQVAEPQIVASRWTIEAADARLGKSAASSKQNSQKKAGCLECGTAENIYDGYCYYCHPDFLFICDRCGSLWPAHRTPNGMCDPCTEEVKNGAPKDLNRKKVVTETCIECGSAPGEYDGYCYYCHPDFLFICKKCGCLWPAHRTPSGLCYDCEAPDATTGATPTVPDGMCKACGAAPGDYDGYCYYCHPDFGFTCSKCGSFYPAHRTSSGLCPSCENPA